MPFVHEDIERHGTIEWSLWDPDGSLASHGVARNLITELGDQFYAERAWLTPTPPAAGTGMQLGTSTAAVTKNGAGSAINTFITNSSVGFDVGYPASSLTGGGARRIQLKSTWVAGIATATIQEVTVINQAITTNSGAPAANTIARALTGTITKGALQILQIVWNHDGKG